MALPVPVVGTDPGPQWAIDINSCLALIDLHDHASGSGVQITPAGLNITGDLTFKSNNATLLRSVRFSAQSAPISNPTDLGCIYESGVDLYYNDGAGNRVRITQSGAVAGTPGSIANLVSPASAVYSAGSTTFVWESDANTAANMDAGSLILRNATASSNGLTLAPPNAMASDFTITLPTLPAQQNIMTLDATGSVAASWNVDNSTLEVSANTLRVKDHGITQVKLATRTTGTTVAAGGVAVSAPTSFVAHNPDGPVSGTSVTITTTGRPVMVSLVPDPASAGVSYLEAAANNGAGTPANFTIQFFRGVTNLSGGRLMSEGGTDVSVRVPPSSFMVMDFPTAGTYTYTWTATFTGVGPATDAGIVEAVCLMAYEI